MDLASNNAAPAPSYGEAPKAAGTALASWRSGLGALVSFPVVFIVAFAGVFALELVRIQFVLSGGEHSTRALLMSVVTPIVYALLLAPVALLTHRYVLMGEHGSLGQQPVSRLKAFFRFVLLWSLFVGIPGMLYTLLALVGLPGLGMIFIFWYIPIVIYAVRTLILFPAIAADAPAATWRNANEDSRGHGWRILGIMILCSVPLLLWQAVIVIAYSGSQLPAFGGRMVLHGVDGALQVVTASVYAAAASRLYQSYGRLLNGAAPLPAADEGVAPPS